MTPSTAELTPVAYVVLGLLARDGASTPYDLKGAADRGVSFVWPVQHSQLYSEPTRLAAMGLVREQREEHGRRRKVYEITAAGEQALAAWLADPTGEAPRVRSIGMLKLFFGRFASPEDVAALARAQLAVHEEAAAHARQILDRLAESPEREHQYAVCEMALSSMEAMVAHWRSLAVRFSTETSIARSTSAGTKARQEAGSSSRPRRSNQS